ncbi:helix-turn-helix transcriptional regulator [Bacillus thuringiensis]|uniref:helix-turn-helix domain-containing protein n=1 Tax=Bacillus cereus group TaxID=86661 RepID=UPI000BF14834|nr:helix-turn-helix transcriptional regulator [Bacillus wiedmannii]MED2749530.1 helix-turn-helix transcriptional regulator [Bacillus thuringiensis]MED2755535.1 helix-turn-helix transcriptional regulator [Bacillus thuringiensis]MED2769784.1 helix-turn-helix transcriptional regulator [Bacillus thuringiensis]MED2773433.1 helix-turn-helix transcriptional regulator [Bacillus thuringiensis]MED2782717.1 helix-turn-helix transcriptional regulator [Bacillus thuringiensis]
MFKQRLKALRLEKKSTQQDVADFLKVAKSNISRFESGKQTPSRETVTKLAQYFNVTVDYMLGLSEYPNLDHLQSTQVKKQFLHLLSRIEKLNTEQQKMILTMLDSVVDSSEKK